MFISKKFLGLLCAVLFLAGCHSLCKKGGYGWKQKGEYGKKKCCKLWQSSAGYASILPVNGSDKGPVGTVNFEKIDKKQVQIQAHIEGLKPNQQFGFHVHEFGDCSNKALQAGGHFNPWNQKHGGLTTQEKHLGDMGNLKSDKEGKAAYKVVISGPLKAFLGRSVIIHEKADDLKSQPSGNAGGRVACGIIGHVMSTGVKDDAKHKASETKKASKSAPEAKKSESVKAVPVKAAAKKAGTVKATPVKAASKAGAVKATPVKAASKAGTVKATPVKAASKAGAVKATPVKAASKAGTVKATPVKAVSGPGSAKSNPVKTVGTATPKAPTPEPSANSGAQKAK